MSQFHSEGRVPDNNNVTIDEGRGIDSVAVDFCAVGTPKIDNGDLWRIDFQSAVKPRESRVVGQTEMSLP